MSWMQKPLEGGVRNHPFANQVCNHSRSTKFYVIGNILFIMVIIFHSRSSTIINGTNLSGQPNFNLKKKITWLQENLVKTFILHPLRNKFLQIILISLDSASW